MIVQFLLVVHLGVAAAFIRVLCSMIINSLMQQFHPERAPVL
jgi:hypothetical protein